MKYESRIPATIMAALTRTVARRGFLIGALCSLAIVVSAKSASDDRTVIPIAVLDTFKSCATTPGCTTTPGFGSSFVGVFRAIIDEEVVTGTSRMDVNVAGGIATCKFTWVRSDGKGTLVVASVCVLADGHGAWHVEKGTGCFKNFTGIGTETFGNLPPGGAFTGFERFAGIGTFAKHGDDRHDDD